MEKFLIHGEKDDYEIVVGLEVNAQVNSQSKLFSGSSTNFGSKPNENVSLVDAAMPGMLPVINEFCIKQAIKSGLGLNAKINKLEEQVNQKVTFEQELKGILSLDDKQLSPILEKMNDMKVADLYQGSNSNQKQKILRCLDPERAAKLLEAVIK